MRYASNDLRLPDVDTESDDTDPERMSTSALLGDPRPEATAQLHYRLGPPLLALAFALLAVPRSEEHTSELQSLMRISYAVFCLKKKKPIQPLGQHNKRTTTTTQHTNNKP